MFTIKLRKDMGIHPRNHVGSLSKLSITTHMMPNCSALYRHWTYHSQHPPQPISEQARSTGSEKSKIVGQVDVTIITVAVLSNSCVYFNYAFMYTSSQGSHVSHYSHNKQSFKAVKPMDISAPQPLVVLYPVEQNPNESSFKAVENHTFC